MKKIISMLLAVMMIATLTVTAFADDAVPTGSITINGLSITDGDSDDSPVVYSVYKLLDLDSYDKTSGFYSYKVADEWLDFFQNDATAKKYFTVEPGNYIAKNELLQMVLLLLSLQKQLWLMPRLRFPSPRAVRK